MNELQELEMLTRRLHTYTKRFVSIGVSFTIGNATEFKKEYSVYLDTTKVLDTMDEVREYVDKKTGNHILFRKFG